MTKINYKHSLVFFISAKKFNKIAGIHNGTTAYAKEMLKMGYKLVTVLSDFRIMNSFSVSSMIYRYYMIPIIVKLGG